MSLVVSTNGVELQTVAWYTLARKKLAGLAGVNEGMAIIEALVSWPRAVFWPQQVHARAEIITGLSQRLQTELRAIAITTTDLKLLYETEHIFSRLMEVLCSVELTRLSQLQTLQSWFHSKVVRLENSSNVEEQKGVAGTTDKSTAG